jgi:DNA-binding NarL/FixJ family response regulator
MNRVIDDNKILELYDKGYLHREIAKELGYGVSTVTKHLIDMGIRSQMVDKILSRNFTTMALLT